MAEPTWLTLLWPRWRSVLHAPRAASPGRRLAGVLFGVLGVLFWLGIFGAACWFFQRCIEVELVGPLIIRKVLEMAFLVFLSVLLFSNLIAAFSTFFLADDLQLQMALPTHVDRVYLARLGETALHSSWMILIFGLPILGAAGLVFQAGWHYYLLALAVLPPFVLTAAVLGSSVTILLVLLFPARRTRDLLLLLAVIGFSILFVLFRLLRPERLLDESQFRDMVSFLSAFQTPQAGWLPSSWVVRAIFPALRGEVTAGLGELFLLYLTAGATLVLGTWLARPMLRRAYSRSLEGAGPGGADSTRRRTVAPDRIRVGSPVQEILRKEVLVFLRDPSQWSQLLLLVALVVVYVLNFKNFQLLSGSGLLSRMALYHLNLGLTGFVLAAVGTRLIFPSISLEGRAFWLLRCAPLSVNRILWAKFLAGLVPTLLLGLVIIEATNVLIGTPWLLNLASVLTVFALAFLVAGMGTGLGALFPSFEAENATRIAAGYGGIAYMILTMSSMLVVLALAAWPVWVFRRLLWHRLPSPRDMILASLLLLLALAATALCTGLPLWLGARRLQRLED